MNTAYALVHVSRGVQQINNSIRNGYEIIACEFMHHQVAPPAPGSNTGGAIAYIPYALMGLPKRQSEQSQQELDDLAARAAEDEARLQIVNSANPAASPLETFTPIGSGNTAVSQQATPVAETPPPAPAAAPQQPRPAPARPSIQGSPIGADGVRSEEVMTGIRH